MDYKVITFNKVGYDPFIDFIKAYAIICVLIAHTFPYLDYMGSCFWIDMQVPLFVLVQSFHFFKKDSISVNLKIILWRVFIPFILVQFVIITLLYLNNCEINYESILKQGGLGLGGYYPWVYLQIAIILPLMCKWMRNKSTKFIFLTYLFICEAFEVFFSIIDLPNYLYRLLAVRYIFLLYFGWRWVKEGVVINYKNFFISVISFFAIVYFAYFPIDNEPFFYNTPWKYHRWPCYFYVALGGTFLLHSLYQYIMKFYWLERSVNILAKCSYEIFLLQMACITPLHKIIVDNKLFHINGIYLIFLYIFFVFFISIIGGYFFNKCYNDIYKKL